MVADGVAGSAPCWAALSPLLANHVLRRHESNDFLKGRSGLIRRYRVNVIVHGARTKTGSNCSRCSDCISERDQQFAAPPWRRPSQSQVPSRSILSNALGIIPSSTHHQTRGRKYWTVRELLRCRSSPLRVPSVTLRVDYEPQMNVAQVMKPLALRVRHHLTSETCKRIRTIRVPQNKRKHNRYYSAETTSISKTY